VVRSIEGTLEYNKSISISRFIVCVRLLYLSSADVDRSLSPILSCCWSYRSLRHLKVWTYSTLSSALPKVSTT
jgi:hypothetical protein